MHKYHNCQSARPPSASADYGFWIDGPADHFEPSFTITPFILIILNLFVCVRVSLWLIIDNHYHFRNNLDNLPIF
jgi:hypothetical protein